MQKAAVFNCWQCSHAADTELRRQFRAFGLQGSGKKRNHRLIIHDASVMVSCYVLQNINNLQGGEEELKIKFTCAVQQVPKIFALQGGFFFVCLFFKLNNAMWSVSRQGGSFCRNGKLAAIMKSNSDCAGDNEFRGKSERGGKIVWSFIFFYSCTREEMCGVCLCE